MLAFVSLFLLFLVDLSIAATADQWRGRSVYQILTDRFALPDGADPTKCDPGAQTWCGGTWNSIRAKLDYVQKAGFTAIWISPVSQNYEGPRSAYGDPYHGYWIQDASQLNSKFGTADDLKALSDELHRRGMYLMVDVVVNNVMATSTTPDYSKYMFKDQSQYHKYCPIQWGNENSQQVCWFGDEKVPLPDLKTEDPTVASKYQSWIKQLVSDYGIDGLRIDAAKHVNTEFWRPFCDAAGVFCIGEVFDDAVPSVAKYQGPLDSVLNYPMYNALVEAFTIPGPGNVSAVADVLAQTQKQYKDPTVLGNFLENQDLPRWKNISVDPQSLYNAMAFTFMSDGIPIVYYGQEQPNFKGAADPFNREPLWPSKYDNTSAGYTLIQQLNQLRNFLVNTTDWATQQTKVLTTSPHGISIIKGNVLSLLTTIGSPPQQASLSVYTPFDTNVATTDVLSCTQYVVGSNGAVEVNYGRGGRPVILMPSQLLTGSGFCENSIATAQGHSGNTATNSNAAAIGVRSSPWTFAGSLLLFWFGVRW